MLRKVIIFNGCTHIFIILSLIKNINSMSYLLQSRYLCLIKVRKCGLNKVIKNGEEKDMSIRLHKFMIHNTIRYHLSYNFLMYNAQIRSNLLLASLLLI